jgi:hypothetical protein
MGLSTSYNDGSINGRAVNACGYTAIGDLLLKRNFGVDVMFLGNGAEGAPRHGLRGVTKSQRDKLAISVLNTIRESLTDPYLASLRFLEVVVKATEQFSAGERPGMPCKVDACKAYVDTAVPANREAGLCSLHLKEQATQPGKYSQLRNRPEEIPLVFDRAGSYLGSSDKDVRNAALTLTLASLAPGCDAHTLLHVSDELRHHLHKVFPDLMPIEAGVPRPYPSDRERRVTNMAIEYFVASTSGELNNHGSQRQLPPNNLTSVALLQQALVLDVQMGTSVGPLTFLHAMRLFSVAPTVGEFDLRLALQQIFLRHSPASFQVHAPTRSVFCLESEPRPKDIACIVFIYNHWEALLHLQRLQQLHLAPSERQQLPAVQPQFFRYTEAEKAAVKQRWSALKTNPPSSSGDTTSNARNNPPAPPPPAKGLSTGTASRATSTELQPKDSGNQQPGQARAGFGAQPRECMTCQKNFVPHQNGHRWCGDCFNSNKEQRRAKVSTTASNAGASQNSAPAAPPRTSASSQAEKGAAGLVVVPHTDGSTLPSASAPQSTASATVPPRAVNQPPRGKSERTAIKCKECQAQHWPRKSTHELCRSCFTSDPDRGKQRTQKLGKKEAMRLVQERLETVSSEAASALTAMARRALARGTPPEEVVHAIGTKGCIYGSKCRHQRDGNCKRRHPSTTDRPTVLVRGQSAPPVPSTPTSKTVTLADVPGTPRDALATPVRTCKFHDERQRLTRLPQLDQRAQRLVSTVKAACGLSAAGEALVEGVVYEKVSVPMYVTAATKQYLLSNPWVLLDIPLDMADSASTPPLDGNAWQQPKRRNHGRKGGQTQPAPQKAAGGVNMQ